jgi:Uma2 family endonuclease
MILTPPHLVSSARPRRKFTVEEFERMVKLGILPDNHPAVLISGEVVMKHSLRTPYRFTVEEYEQLVRHGILTENDRVELIRGEILEKMTIGNPHIACVNRVTRLLIRNLGDGVIVSVQNPVRLGDSEPEPDVAVLTYRADEYATGKAGPADILLVIEVADSSLNEDRGSKLGLYAESGVREYWIVNLNDDCLEVYRSPQADGGWGERLVLRRGDHVEIQTLPGIALSIADLLPSI